MDIKKKHIQLVFNYVSFLFKFMACSLPPGGEKKTQRLWFLWSPPRT